MNKMLIRFLGLSLSLCLVLLKTNTSVNQAISIQDTHFFLNLKLFTLWH